MNTDVTVIAAAADFGAFRTDITSIGLQIVFVVFFVFAIRGYIQNQWGQLIGNVIGLVVVTWILTFPDSFQTVVANLGQSIFGG